MKCTVSLRLVSRSFSSGRSLVWILASVLALTALSFESADAGVGDGNVDGDQQARKASGAQVSSAAKVSASSKKSSAKAAKDYRSAKAKKSISESEALAKVKALPEVKQFLALFKGGKSKLNGVAKIEVEPDQGKWLVHVYEQLPDHTATMSWYEVDMKTGKISKQF